MKPGKKGLSRVKDAAGYSLQGIGAAWKHEAAFRQEVCLLIVSVIVALLLPFTLLERAVLIGLVLFVMVVELLNSALEAVVDRISDEHHELSGRAKDMGSAAVMISILIAAIVWVGAIGELL